MGVYVVHDAKTPGYDNTALHCKSRIFQTKNNTVACCWLKETDFFQSMHGDFRFHHLKSTFLLTWSRIVSHRRKFRYSDTGQNLRSSPLSRSHRGPSSDQWLCLQSDRGCKLLTSILQSTNSKINSLASWRRVGLLRRKLRTFSYNRMPQS